MRPLIEDIDSQIAELEQQLNQSLLGKKLHKLKEFRKEWRELDSTDSKAAVLNGAPKKTPVDTRRPVAVVNKKEPNLNQPTAFDRIKNFFDVRNNQWASQTEMRQALGIDKGRLSGILYVRYVDRFEKQKSSSGNNQWRLKQDVA